MPHDLHEEKIVILITEVLMLQNPRVCILGGGFGGLYTALRLESLVWDDDKKPQVRSSLMH